MFLNWILPAPDHLHPFWADCYHHHLPRWHENGVVRPSFRCHFNVGGHILQGCGQLRGWHLVLQSSGWQCLVCECDMDLSSNRLYRIGSCSLDCCVTGSYQWYCLPELHTTHHEVLFKLPLQRSCADTPPPTQQHTHTLCSSIQIAFTKTLRTPSDPQVSTTPLGGPAPSVHNHTSSTEVNPH